MGRGLAVVFVSGLAVMPITAIGGEWSSVFSSSMTMSYEDNPTLSVDDETPNGQSRINPTLTTSYEEERYRINSGANASLVRSTDQTVAADSLRYGFDIDGEYDLETSVISAAVSLDLSSVQDTEFDDTGVLANNSDVTRTSSSLQFGFDRVLSDFWRVNMNDNFNMVSFSGGNFTNSTNNSLLVSLNNEYSEFLTLTPSIGFDRFSPEDGKPSNTFRANFGGDYTFTDVTDFGLTLGLLSSDGGLGWSARASFDHEFEEDITITSTATRDVIPSSSGVLRQSTGLTSNLAYQFAEDITVNWSTSWRTSSQSGGGNSGNTVQIEFSPTVSWVLTEEWRASVSYRERRQTQPSQGTARTRSVTFALNYSMPYQF